MNTHWHVLCSKPNKEMVLWRELMARSFDCFYPSLHVRPVNPRSRKIRPYFPSYLFIQADIEQVGVSTFQRMPFSNGLLAFDGIPAIVPQAVIQGIRRHVELLNQAGAELINGLKHGELVIIQGGAFDGYEAIFDTRLPGTERVRVLLSLLQARPMKLELPASQIQRPRAAYRQKPC